DSEKTVIFRIEKLAENKEWKMCQVALVWIQTKFTSPIVGANSLGELEENIIKGLGLASRETDYLEKPFV
ncbi:hypothetical protein BV22DRAFT_995711, partial [Leucogyrophana mollusca]